jgi:putative ABC transport system permease protein
MRLGRILRHRLRSLFRRSRTESDLRRELDVHVEQLTKEHIAAGMTEPEARLAALREFGPLESAKEQCRDMRRVNLVESVSKDLAYAFRVLRKSPGFTLTAVVSLALGIGATTAILNVVNALLLRPLPFPEADHVVVLFATSPKRGIYRDTTSFPTFQRGRIKVAHSPAPRLTGRTVLTSPATAHPNPSWDCARPMSC